MKITVHKQILSGNLGDGWDDENEAAYALSAYTEKIWLADLQYLIDDGHEVEIDISVEQNTSGVNRGVSVSVDLDAGEDDDENTVAYETEQSVLAELTYENIIWERFCSDQEQESGK